IWDPSLVIDINGDLLSEPVRIAVDGARQYASLPQKYGKPIICLRFGRIENDIMEQILEKGGIPVYDTPEQCARAMSALFQYGTVRGKIGLEKE
ncbi:MAG: hypothetical protein JXI32_08185, partial [Deltaproteobacteria bacterium]|nr:hypothetical protein [Deltaproteobacteria bacterium]